MRVALLGTRGIPASYGGFETFAEELSVRLAERGHRVVVYCRGRRRRGEAETYRGVRLTKLPTIRHKYLDTIFHTALSTAHLLFRRFDVVLYCNGANALFTIAPRLLGMPTALNVDGLERRREKWNALARGWYALSERLATRLPSAIVSDAEVIRRYYLERYGARSELIVYGADAERLESTEALDALGLSPGEYFLYVSRMEPENNALLTVEAFRRARLDKKLVMVGDAPYAADYIRLVREAADDRVIFPGAIYGRGYRELQSHCLAYIQATEVGGTHPALIEAMGRGAAVLYLDTPENAEVAGGVGLPFAKDASALAARVEEVAAMSPAERAALGQRAAARTAERYSWAAVADRYEDLFRRLAGRASAPGE